MPSLLPNLTNESILVMYLAGELPDEDRAEVERLLTIDATLRGQLEELRASYDEAEAAFASADATERVSLSSSAAARRVGQAVRSWHARRLKEPAGDGFVPMRLRLPRDRKSTRLNSSHANISYAVFCLKKKNHHRSRLCVR